MMHVLQSRGELGGMPLLDNDASQLALRVGAVCETEAAAAEAVWRTRLDAQALSDFSRALHVQLCAERDHMSRLQLEHAQQQELLRQQAGQVVTALQGDQAALAYQAAQAVARAEAAERLVLEQRAFAEQQFASLAARADEAEQARAAAEQTVQMRVLEAQESLRQQFTQLLHAGLAQVGEERSDDLARLRAEVSQGKDALRKLAASKPVEATEQRPVVLQQAREIAEQDQQLEFSRARIAALEAEAFARNEAHRQREAAQQRVTATS